MTLNRLSGLAVVVFGTLLLFWVIPVHTEPVDYGWLRPATLPNITAVVIILSGLIHVLFPAGTAEFDGASAKRAGLFFAISWIPPSMLDTESMPRTSITSMFISGAGHCGKCSSIRPRLGKAS